MILPPREIQENYITGIVKLMLWYMHQLMVSQRVSFSDALLDYVDIYRKTACFYLEDPSETGIRLPEWGHYRSKLEHIFRQSLEDGAQSPVMSVEIAGLDLLWPALDERISKGLPLVEYRQETSFGCFFYNLEGPVIDLHFVNKEIPNPPFEHPVHRQSELRELLTHCQNTHAGLEMIQMGSWLNAYEPFRQLFPMSWVPSGETKGYNSLAWWGQFINYRGEFHVNNAARFRDTGYFPYPCTFNQCRISDLMAHLDAPLGEPQRNT